MQHELGNGRSADRAGRLGGAVSALRRSRVVRLIVSLRGWYTIVRDICQAAGVEGPKQWWQWIVDHAAPLVEAVGAAYAAASPWFDVGVRLLLALVQLFYG